MIYADPSFLVSFYSWDENTEAAAWIYAKDNRRPLLLTPWQRYETRNAIRQIVCRLKRARLTVPFQPGNVFKRIEEDLDTGRLRHAEVDWRASLRLAEELSNEHTQSTGAAAGDLWHVATAALLEADTFWTFDEEQRDTASRCGKFRHVPNLLKA